MMLKRPINTVTDSVVSFNSPLAIEVLTQAKPYNKMFKLFLVVCLVAVAHAGVIGSSVIVPQLGGQVVATNGLVGTGLGLGGVVGPVGLGGVGVAGVGLRGVGLGGLGLGNVGLGGVGVIG